MSQNIETIARDVSYEWDMLRWTFEKIRYEEGQSLPSKTTHPQILTTYWVGTCRDDRLRSAMLESFLLHTRSLRDFLCHDRKRYREDVLAGDFFDDSRTWAKVRPPLGKYLVQNKERLDTTLAHISYSRLRFKAAGEWDIAAVLLDLDLIWQAFLAALPPERRKWFCAE